LVNSRHDRPAQPDLEKNMNREVILIIVIIASWIILNKWILPALGIPTCMSGGCCGGTRCGTPLETEAHDRGEQDADVGPESRAPVNTERG